MGSKHFRIEFDDQTMLFDERFPSELSGLMLPEEFDSILKKINTDLNMELMETTQKFRKCAKIWQITAYLGIGLFVTPLMIRRTRRQYKMLELYWQRVKAYLAECNRKVFSKRRLEWKLMEEVKKLKGRDATNPLYAYRIDIVQKPGKHGKGKNKVGEIDVETGTTTETRIGDTSAISTTEPAGPPFFGTTTGEETFEGASMKRPSRLSGRRVSFTSKVVEEGNELREEDEFSPSSGIIKSSGGSGNASATATTSASTSAGSGITTTAATAAAIISVPVAAAILGSGETASGKENDSKSNHGSNSPSESKVDSDSSAALGEDKEAWFAEDEEDQDGNMLMLPTSSVEGSMSLSAKEPVEPSEAQIGPSPRPLRKRDSKKGLSELFRESIDDPTRKSESSSFFGSLPSE